MNDFKLVNCYRQEDWILWV